MPRVESHVQFVDAIDERGEDFFRVVCEHDLEGSWRSRNMARTALTDCGRTG